MDIRDDIAATVDAWARQAHGETYLSERLHPKARGWLIDHIETLLRNKGVSSVGHAQSTAVVKPAKVIKPAPEPVAATERASTEASTEASKGPAEKPADIEPVPTMEELKGKLKGKKKGKQA